MNGAQVERSARGALARYLADPYAFYRSLRSEDPVRYNSDAGYWTLTRHADIVAALQHPGLSSRRPTRAAASLATRAVDEEIARWLLRMDPPEHTRIRGLCNQALRGGLSPSLRPRIEAMGDRLLEAAQQRGGMDLVADFAAPLSLHALALLIGLPETDVTRVKRWSNDVAQYAEAASPHPVLAERARRSLDATKAYLSALIAERRRRPHDDLLTRLASASSHDHRLGDAEIIAAAELLLLAGHDTTTHAIANGALLLLRRPEAIPRGAPWSRPALDELLRLDTPLQGLLRTAAVDLELAGRRIQRGQSVLLWLGAGNHDPEAFAEPEAFHPGRGGRSHLSFGHGRHACLGAPLASLVAEVAMTKLFDPARTLRLRRGPLAWQGNVLFRCQAELPVSLSF